MSFQKFPHSRHTCGAANTLLRASLIMGLCLAPLGMSWAQSGKGKSAPAAAPAAASTGSAAGLRVNGELQPTTRSDVLLQEQLSRGLADSAELRNTLRESLIIQALMAQEAVKAGLDKQPAIQARVDLARQSTLSLAWQQQQLADIRISDEEIKAEYQREVQSMGTTEYRIRHVLAADEATARQVLEKAQKGVSLADLATEFSRDPVSRQRGGLSDWIADGRLAPAIKQVVEQLGKGQLANSVVSTGNGWQVIQLDDKQPFKAISLEQATPQIRQALAQRALQARVAALRQSAKVD